MLTRAAPEVVLIPSHHYEVGNYVVGRNHRAAMCASVITDRMQAKSAKPFHFSPSVA